MGDDLEFKVRGDWKKLSENNPWLYFVPEFAKDENGQRYMRKKGGEVIYRVISMNGSEEVYECTQCYEEVIHTSVPHPVREPNLIFSDLIPQTFRNLFTRNEYEERVPYCPRCEEEPVNGRAIDSINT